MTAFVKRHFPLISTANTDSNNDKDNNNTNNTNNNSQCCESKDVNNDQSTSSTGCECAQFHLDESSLTEINELIQQMLLECNQSAEIQLRLDDSLYSCICRLSDKRNLHLLYAVSNNIRRCA